MSEEDSGLLVKKNRREKYMSFKVNMFIISKMMRVINGILVDQGKRVNVVIGQITTC